MALRCDHSLNVDDTDNCMQLSVEPSGIDILNLVRIGIWIRSELRDRFKIGIRIEKSFGDFWDLAF
jgi:hypothetical protein